MGSLYLSSDYWSQNDSVFLVRILAASARFRVVSVLRLKALYYSHLPSTDRVSSRICLCVCVCIHLMSVYYQNAISEGPCGQGSLFSPLYRTSKDGLASLPFPVCHPGLGFTVLCLCPGRLVLVWTSQAPLPAGFWLGLDRFMPGCPFSPFTAPVSHICASE